MTTSKWAQAMLRDPMAAFASRDTTLAQGVLTRDDTLDRLKTEIIRELVASMLHDRRTIESAINLILISRHLKRVGDHATNIGEDVIVVVAARDVRHHVASLS